MSLGAAQLTGQRVLQHEAYSGQATILLAFSRPVQGLSCSVLCEWPFFCKAHPAESSDVDVQSGQFLRHHCIVQIFQHANLRMVVLGLCFFSCFFSCFLPRMWDTRWPWLANQVGCEAGWVWATFSRPVSMWGGTIPKRCCLVAQGASDCCCCLFNKQATNILNHLHAELELWLGMSNTCRFSLSLSL